MPFFSSFSEILAGLSPRHRQSADRQQLAQRHHYSLSPRRPSLSQAKRTRPAEKKYSLGISSEEEQASNPASPPVHDPAASPQVRTSNI